MDENRKKLYDQLSANYDMGTFDEFDSDLDNEDNQKVAWEAMGGQDGYGDFGLFQQAIARSPQAEETQQAEPIATQPIATQPDAAPLMEAQQPDWTTTASAMPGEEDADADISLPDAPNPGTPKDASAVNDGTTENKPTVTEDKEQSDNATSQAEDYSTKSEDELYKQLGVQPGFTQKDLDKVVQNINAIADPDERRSAFAQAQAAYNEIQRRDYVRRDAQERANAVAVAARNNEVKVFNESISQLNDNNKYITSEVNKELARLSTPDSSGTSEFSRSIEGFGADALNQEVDSVRTQSKEQLMQTLINYTFDRSSNWDERAMKMTVAGEELTARENGGHAKTFGERTYENMVSSVRQSSPELADEIEKHADGFNNNTPGHASSFQDHGEAALDDNPAYLIPRLAIALLQKRRAQAERIALSNFGRTPTSAAASALGGYYNSLSAEDYDACFKQAWSLVGDGRIYGYIGATMRKFNETEEQALDRFQNETWNAFIGTVSEELKPKDNLSYILDYIIHNNFISKSVQSLHGFVDGKSQFGSLYPQVLAQYAKEHPASADTWGGLWNATAQIAAPTLTFLADAKMGAFILPSVIGKATTSGVIRLFGGETAAGARSMMQNGFVKYFAQAVGSSANFGAFEMGMELQNMLITGEGNIVKLFGTGLKGMLKGAGLGVATATMGKLFERATGWKAYVGEMAKLGVEAGAFTGMGYLEAKLSGEGDFGFTDIGTNIGMVVGSKFSHYKTWLKDVRARANNEGVYGKKVNYHQLSDREHEMLNSLGYKNVGKALKGMSISQEDVVTLKRELGQMHLDSRVPWETVRCAEWVINGRVCLNPDVADAAISGDAINGYTVTAVDAAKRPVRAGITVKGNDAKNALVQHIKKEAEIAKYTQREQDMRYAQNAREQARVAQLFCASSNGKYTDVSSTLSVFYTAVAKRMTGQPMGNVESEVLAGMDALFESAPKPADIVGEFRKSVESAYDVDLEKAIAKQASERIDAEKKAISEYDAWLDRNKNILDCESEQFQNWLTGYEPGVGDAVEEATPKVEEAMRNAKTIPEHTEEERQQLQEHFNSWSGRINMDGVELVHNFDDIETQKAREEIEKGNSVPGWYDDKTGKSYIYLPHIIDKRDMDTTILHEVIAHKGLRMSMPKGEFDKFCDKVWEQMSTEDRKRFGEYPGVKEIDDKDINESVAKQRAAADEFVARLAESTDVESHNRFKRIVLWLKEIFGKYFGIDYTTEDSEKTFELKIEDAVRKSYQNLREGRGGDAANGTVEAERGNEAALDTEGEAPREETAEPATEEVIAPTETVETPPAAESEPPVVESEPQVERPTSAVGRVEGTPADMNDWAELLAENDAASLPVEEVQAGLELMEREREQAHRYANGELAEEPSDWEYWAARDGLSEPTRQAEPVAAEPPVAETPKEPVVETESQHTEPVATEAPTETAQRDTKLPKGANAEAETMEPSELPMTEHITKMTDAWGDVTRVEVVGQNDNGTTRVRLWFKNRDQRGVEADVDLRGPQPPETPTPPTEPTGDATTAGTTTDVTTERPAEVTGSADDRQMNDVLSAKLGEVDEEAERRAAQEADPYYMPMENKGGGRMSPNYRKATAEQIFNHLNDRENASGRGTLDGNIAAGVKRAEDKLKEVRRKEPKGEKRSDEAMDRWEKELAEAQAQADKWHEVERMRREQKAAEGDDSDPTWKQAYDEFNSSDEEPVNLEDYVARHLYGTKFKWKDKEFVRLGGRTHGLGGHLGLSKSDKERRAFFGWIDEKNGSYPESVAEGLYANMPDWMRERYDTMEILDAVLNVVGSNPRPRDMVVDYVKRLREQNRDMDEYYADEAAGARGFADAGEMDAYDNMREREATGFHDVAAAGREADSARADLLADAQARLNDPNASEFEKQAARTVLRYRQREGRDRVTAQGTEGDEVRFRVVRDPREVERLERGKKVKRYRTMQLIDGKLYPPMSARVNGQLREPTELGVWEQADESPELARNGKFRLDKGQRGQGTVDAAYNPYFHTSTSAMNDQFSSAWKRPELVVVEVEIPESELTSGYRAAGAKDSVGDTDWKSGSVNNALPADRQRTVTLSRWMKAVRIVPDTEVADMIAHQLDGTDISIPFNVVNENLRNELVKRGVKIGEPEKSNAGRASLAAYEQWNNEAESGGARFRIRGEHETGDRVGEKEEKGYRSLFDGMDVELDEPRVTAAVERERVGLKEQLAQSSDEELLREIGESSAEDRTFYSEEYDRRHLKEYNEMCDNYWKMLNDGKVEFEQAEEMLLDAIHDWREGHASAERTRLLAQFDTLNAYYAEKQEEAWEREDAEHDGPVESATSPRGGEQAPLPPAPTPTFDPTAIGLRQLADGETSYVQRRYERSGQFDFTGSERIESADDVAYIFRNLENSAIENVFLVLVKDGRGTILHVGMGDYRTSLGHIGAGYLAASELRPDKVVMVHNHPSGSLKPSTADLELHNKVVRMFGDDVVAPSIIIDTTRGEYSEFDAMTDYDAKARKRSTAVEIPYDTYTFSRQVFAPDYNPATAFTVRSSEDVAKFVSSHRLGERPKVSLIVLDNRNHVVGNVFLPYTELKSADASRASDETARYVHQMGRNRAILYGRVGSVDGAAVKSIKSALRDRDVSLVDFIDVNRGSYNDRGMLNEAGARYAGIEGPRDGHEAAVEDARRRLESDDASEFERTAARAVIKAYGGGDAPDTPDGGGPRFRIREPQKAIDDYERAVNSSGFQVTEALQDSMMGLKKLMQAIVGKDAKGKEKAIQDIAGFENAYLKENRLQSESVAQVDEYRTRYYTPLVKAVSALIGKGGKKHRTEATAELTDYMMAKHGLERNLVLAERDATEEFESDANKDGNGNYIRNYADILAEKREKDYSGLTALTGEADVAAAEDAARQMVDNYEMGHDTTELWQRTKQATDATLDKLHDSGVLSDEAYDRAKTMFEYYIPLRGWDETTSDEVYGYLTGPDGPLNGNVFKHAEGRRSKADDPLATIMMMASDAIRQGNRNVMKQRFLTFVLNNPSDAVSVSRLWLQRDPVTDEWKPVFADLDPTDSPEVVRQKVEQFEQDMAQLAQQDPDNFKHGKQTENIPYKVVNGNIGEHRVLVKHNGQTYVMTINGNPRAAQALNGLTNPDTRANNFVGKTLGAFAKLNRVLSQLFTTYSPKFVVRNFARDMGYSIASSAFVKEGGEYGRKFVTNYATVGFMGKLFTKWEDGTLDRSKPLENLFYEFMHNGGETGFSAPKELKDYKKALDKELRKENSKTRQLLGSFGEFYLRANRAVENRARFAAFVTSMEMGRGVDRSIWDAKEVSVNFNKKGAGAKMFDNPDQTLAGKTAGLIGDGGRSLFVFWNASVQGLTNYGKTFKAHPVKATAHASLLAGLAYMMPQLMQAIFGNDDGYYDLPDYVRRNNICFRWSKDMPWITIPLSPEHAVSYAIGDIIAGIASGKKQYLNGEEIANDFAKEVSKALPLDFTEGGGGHWWLPSAIKPAYEAYEMNESWTGAPIANQTEWNKQAPEYQRVYKTASQPFVKASEWVNDLTNSDEDSKGLINFNPSKLEYVFKGYAGGLATLFNDCVRMFDVAFGDAEFEAHDIPVAGAMLKSGNPTTKQKEMMRQYYHYRDDAEGAKWELKNREGDALERFKQTDRYERYLVWTEMSKDVDKLKKQMKDNPDLEAEYYAAVERLVSAMREQHAGKRKPSQETIAEVKESERKDSIEALTDKQVHDAMVPLSDNAPQDSVDVKREGIKRAYKSEGLSYRKPNDDAKNALAYERHATYDDIAEDTALKGRRDALKKSVGEKFKKMGVKYKNGSAGWDWYAEDDASASIDEIKAYYQSHKAELDEYGILVWWFDDSKGSSGYIKKGFTDGKHNPDEVMKEYREARKEVLAKTKQR